MSKSKEKMVQLTRRLICALTASLVILAYAAPAQAQDGLVLREQIKVFSNLVKLSDLFENAGEASEAPVFRSPELGTGGVVAAKRIAAAARQHGLEWSNPGGIGKVVVRRPGRLISLDEIRGLIGKHAGGEDEAWTVEFSRGAKSFHIDPRVKSPIKIKHIDLQTGTGKFRAIISVENSAPAVQDKIFTGVAYPSIEAIVPARTIERGATIVEDDLKIIRMPRSRVAGTAIEEIETAIGMAARQRLTVGRPVRRTDIEHPKLVKRNEMVTIVYRSPGMILKSKGKALADASRGQSVQIMNLQSKRTVEAQATRPGLVTVSLQNTPPARTAKKAAGSKGARNTFVIR